MTLPLAPPYPPMEARLVTELPLGPAWQYEPKWDGFRCVAVRDGDGVELQSKSGQPLARYFPEVVTALRALKARRFVLDGELVVPKGAGLSFDDLLQRIHPAPSRVERLSRESPAVLVVFDLLVDAEGRRLTDRLHYLYTGNERYWFDLRTNLRREMEDRMHRYDEKSNLYPEVKERLERLVKSGLFSGIHVFTEGKDVPDKIGSDLRLVVLSPDHGHRRKDGASRATQAAQQILTSTSSRM